MTDKISNFTKQIFPEIRRNDQSLNQTIWAPWCNKLHVFDMVEKMERKKLVHWILSLHTTKFYEAKVNSFCMCKLLIKINIVQTRFWEKCIYKPLSYFQKQHILSRLFIKKNFQGIKETNRACQNNSFRLPLTSM